MRHTDSIGSTLYFVAGTYTCATPVEGEAYLVVVTVQVITAPR